MRQSKDRVAKRSRNHLHRKTITAQEIRIVNSKGQLIGRFGPTGDKGPSLSFWDNRGNLRMSLYLHNGQSSIEILDDKEKVRLSVGVAKNGEPAIFLLDRNEQDLIVVDGGPGIDLYDGKGNIRASLSLIRDGDLSPRLALIARDGTTIPVRKSEGSSEVILAFYDGKG